MKTWLLPLALIFGAVSAHAQDATKEAPATAANDSTLAVTEAKPPKLDPSDPNYVRCRRFQETGSLVKSQRVCRTNAEWDKASAHSQNEANRIVESGRSGLRRN